MRVLLVLIAFGMIAVPALLALSQTELARGRRIANALVIFLAPALALILPWCLYVWLSHPRR